MKKSGGELIKKKLFYQQSNSKVEKAVKRHITDTDMNALPFKRNRQSTNETKTKFSASSNVGNINLLYDDVSMHFVLT